MGLVKIGSGTSWLRQGSRINYHYMHTNMSIQRQLTSWKWISRTISQCSKWGKGANHVTIIKSLHLSRIDTCTQIHLFKGNVPAEYRWITPFHSVASGKKEQLMLPLADHLTHQGWSITMWTQIRQFKGNLPAEYDWITQFHGAAIGEKEQIMLPLSDHFTHQG